MLDPRNPKECGDGEDCEPLGPEDIQIKRHIEEYYLRSQIPKVAFTEDGIGKDLVLIL